MGELRQLANLGPETEKQLNSIGIYSKTDIEQMGPINVFLKLKSHSSIRPSLNFLYALIGALEDKNWREIAKSQKLNLILALDNANELEKLLIK